MKVRTIISGTIAATIFSTALISVFKPLIESKKVDASSLSQNVSYDAMEVKKNSLNAGGSFDFIDGNRVTPILPVSNNFSAVHDFQSEDTPTWQCISGFQDNRNGEYTTGGSNSTLKCGGSFTGVNSVMGTFSYTNEATIEGYLSFRIYLSNSLSYRFCLYTNGPVNDNGDQYPPVGIVRKNNDGSNITRVEMERSSFKENSVFTMRVTIENGYAAFFLNDTEIWVTENMSGAEKIVGINVETSQCPTTVKDLKIGYIRPAITNFEFNKDSTVYGFDADNGSIGFTGTELKVTKSSNNDNMVLRSPKIDVAKGHRYSMYLPLRNTILARMKNSSSANKIIVSATGSVEQKVYTKTFDIEPNSDYLTYYFNISDLNPKGYLRSFNFEFVGAKENENIFIDAITFEREEPIYNYAGSIDYLKVNEDETTVTIKGSVAQKYNGKSVQIYYTDPRNVYWEADSKFNSFLVETIAKDSKFEATFDLKPSWENTTLYSRYIMAVVEGIKVDEPKRIDYEAISTNNLVFPNNVANVLDFGAKGDGFTDDNEAFQDAIDHIAELGGGRVYVPGDDSEYGKRYIITQINLCDNCELYIEEGAILWQSQREEELNKTVPIFQRGFDTISYGHNVDIEGLVWCHTFATVNKPLIFTSKKQNVRITGGGMVRMNDTGGEEADAMYFNGDNALAVGLSSRAPQIPLCFYASENIDIINITVARSSAWHCYMNFDRNVYIGNYVEKEICSVTADGFTVTSDKNVTIDHVVTYTSDDSIGICTCYNDPRHQFLRPSFPGEDNATENITVKHVFTYGGFGISWIPWGTEAQNAYYQETRNVEIYDSCIGGHKSTGCWADDPFYGTSATYTYNEKEDNDYCAIKDVYYHDNTYFQNFELFLGKIKLPITNLIVTDKNVNGNTHSPSEFKNEGFDKHIRSGKGFNDESNYVTGLCYWSERPFDENCKLGTDIVDYSLGYSGYIKGNGELFEGLYERSGTYRLNIKTLLKSGTATMFVRDAVTGEIYASTEIASSNQFKVSSLEFDLEKAATLQMGIQHKGNSQTTVYLDDAEIVTLENKNTYRINGTTYDIASMDDIDIYSVGKNVSVSDDGTIMCGADQEYKIMAKYMNLASFGIDVTISGVTKAKHTNAGVYLFGKDIKNAADMISAMNVQVESLPNEDTYTVTIYRFDGNDGFVGGLDASGDLSIVDNKVNLRIIVLNDCLYIFADDMNSPIIEYELDPNTSFGQVGLRSQYQPTTFNNFTLKVAKQAGNFSKLTAFISSVSKTDLSLYTDESVAIFRETLNKAINLPKNSSQTEIDEAASELDRAFKALSLKSGDDPSIHETSEEPQESIIPSDSTVDSAPTSEQKEEKSGCNGNVLATSSLLILLISCFTILHLERRKYESK